jgi:hypothetical protein
MYNTPKYVLGCFNPVRWEVSSKNEFLGRPLSFSPEHDGCEQDLTTRTLGLLPDHRINNN